MIVQFENRDIFIEDESLLIDITDEDIKGFLKIKKQNRENDINEY
jgi:hypothetical protein